MIIWRGWGFLAAVLLFGGLVVAQLIADGLGGEGTYASNTFLYAGLGLIVGGALTFLFARWEHGRNPPRVLVDKETGGEVTFENRSELFFVPMKYWGMLGIAAGAVAIIAGLSGAA